ncbi:hypothetical protein [Limnohabitans sp. 2KL-3]|uniref:hypothetical protein n=1 Tax=Limnohabitans sp. 2KL-3 TaxID=1100700 RepID=UPI000AB3A99E|nr:hypothetical protein [Limnohabitans sp. 2KL-3]
MVSSLTLAQVLLACTLVFAMGIAIQDDGNAMVAAVDEWLKEGATSRSRVGALIYGWQRSGRPKNPMDGAFSCFGHLLGVQWPRGSSPSHFFGNFSS